MFGGRDGLRRCRLPGARRLGLRNFSVLAAHVLVPPAMEAIAPLYLEDLAVGQVFRSDSAPMDLERIKAFAAEFDPQPFHLDEEAAARSLFYSLPVAFDPGESVGPYLAIVDRDREGRPYRFLDPRHAASRRWEMWMDAGQAAAVRAAQRG